MPVKTWECPSCGDQKLTKVAKPFCCDLPMVEIITPPSVKMLERKDESCKSVLKDQEKILKARARKHSRDVETDDNIQNVNNAEISNKAGWIKESGRKRNGVDDI